MSQDNGNWQQQVWQQPASQPACPPPVPGAFQQPAYAPPEPKEPMDDANIDVHDTMPMAESANTHRTATSATIQPRLFLGGGGAASKRKGEGGSRSWRCPGQPLSTDAVF